MSIPAAILALVLAAHLAEGARILAVFPVTSVSHQIVFRAVTTELARRGHELVVITTDPINDPMLANYTEIDISFLYDFYRNNYDFTIFKANNMSPYEMTTYMMEVVFRFCELLMVHEPVAKFISPNNTNEHFDLVFVESFSVPSIYAFAHRFSAPMIGISSLPPFAPEYDCVGNPDNPSYIPSTSLPYSDKMTFFERIYNTIYLLRVKYYFYSKLLPKHQEIVNRHFVPSPPNLEELHTNASLLFVNYDNTFHHPRPEVPAVIHISGLHITSPKPLPQDIRQFLDDATDGAVYFSLGSNIRSNRMEPEKRRMFQEAFAEIPGLRVLWKWESDHLPGQTNNIKIRKWMPQQDILRHRNVRVFVMQGGLQSIEEAIHAGVPMVGMPFFSDQEFNVRRITETGIGVKLDVNDLSTEKILTALKAVFNNRSYSDNVKRLSALMRDQPSTAMERAVWWTEYVLRHKGAAHLRTAAVRMPWYKLMLLDVAAAALLVALLAALLLWCAARFLLRLLWPAPRFVRKHKKN